MRRKGVCLALTLACLGGCDKYAVKVTTAADPAYTLHKAQPIYVVLPKPSSIKERQLAVTLKNELCRSGFTLAPDMEHASYVLGLSFQREEFQFGSTTTAVAVTPSFAIGKTTPNMVRNAIANLYVFDSKQYMSGERLTIWEGQALAPKRVFDVYEPIIFSSVLKNFGATTDRPFKLRRSELKAAKLDSGCRPAL